MVGWMVIALASHALGGAELTRAGTLVGYTAGICRIGFAAFAPLDPPPPVALKTELWAGPVGRFAVLYGARCHAGGMSLVELSANGVVGMRTPVPVRGYPYPFRL